MGTILRLLLVSCVLFSMYSLTSAQSCAKYNFASNQIFSACNDLPSLNSYLHWTHNPSSKTVEIAYRHTEVSSSRWVAWAINPTSQGMVGAQALVAFQKSDGTMRAYTTTITSYQTRLQEGDLSFPVSDLTATFSNNEIIIFAKLNLQNLSSSSLNHVWQDGPLSSDSPAMHATSGPNVQSMATLNLLSGQSGTTASGGGSASFNSKVRKRNIHGLLNAVSWGIVIPLGALIARYLKVFPSADPAWFYLHITCQVSGYIVGVAGWATGLQLGSKSPGITFTTHRTIGIVLFCIATVQVFALLLRPKKDHKYRFHWNVYHHTFGYSIIILSIINIFKGLDILNPEKKWERAYVGILVGLGIVAAILELHKWCTVLRRKKSAKAENLPRGLNGTNGYNGNGYNGYGAGAQAMV